MDNFHYELGIYEIEYPDLGIKQIKKLVSHYQYLKDKSVFKKETPSYAYQIQLHGEVYNLNIKEFFTDESPLYKAIETGTLECNGTYKCIIKPWIKKE